MAKIVVTNDQHFSDEQKARLESLGEVTYYDPLPKDAEEYLERVKGADVICSGTAGLEQAQAQLKNVYLTVGFVSVAFLDLEVLKRNNVMVSNAPGANRHAVAEWIMGMIILLTREFLRVINTGKPLRQDGKLPPLKFGVAGRNITILGYGNIAKRVGRLAEAFDMTVGYFRRGDNLAEAVRDADIVVDTLSSNKATHKMLDSNFFQSMKRGSYFVTVTRSEVVDEDAMLRALDEGRLAGVATDCGGVPVGDADDPYYVRLRSHPKVLATPHISYSTEMSMKVGNDIMIDNVEAYLSGKPINLVSNE